MLALLSPEAIIMVQAREGKDPSWACTCYLWNGTWLAVFLLLSPTFWIEALMQFAVIFLITQQIIWGWSLQLLSIELLCENEIAKVRISWFSWFKSCLYSRQLHAITWLTTVFQNAYLMCRDTTTVYMYTVVVSCTTIQTGFETEVMKKLLF